MRRTRLSLALTLVASATVVGIPSVASAAPAPAVAPDVPVQLLTINDFHGRISDPTGTDSQVRLGPGPNGTFDPPPTQTVPQDDEYVTVGGAANVASTVAATRESFTAAGGSADSSLLIGLGDLVGASPFDSAAFRDESTIEVLNAMGMDVSVVGNHEFDRGTEELRRLSGATDDYDDVTACQLPQADGACFDDSTGSPFTGTDFPYLAANVVDADGEPMLPPYVVQEVQGQRIGFIGVVTETTAGIVAPTGIADVEFVDEADAINRYVPELQAQGVEAIVALVHEGGVNTGTDTTSVNGCAEITGPIVDINERTDAAVDVVLSAHTHQNYSCYLTDPAGQPRLVAQSGFYGRLLGDVRIVIDGETGDVDRLCGTYSVTNVPTDRDARTPDASIAGIVDFWDTESAEIGDVTVGTLPTALPRGASRAEESQLGNTVAEAQLQGLLAEGGAYSDPAATVGGGAPVVAFMNPGGLRADLPAGDVTYRQVFDVQPFGNYVNAVTLTGEQIRLVLEQQFVNAGARPTQLYLGTSDGFAYTYDLGRGDYDRVDPASITIDGVPVLAQATYRVVMNSFLATGGDSFSAFTLGTNPVTGPVDVDTFIDYIDSGAPIPAADHGTEATGTTRVPAPLTPPAGGGGGAGSNGGDAEAAGVSGTLGVGAAGFTCPAVPTTPTPTTPTPGVDPVAGPNPGNGIGTGQLADTGVATGQMLGLGALLLLTGGVATAAGYRRQRGLAD